MPRIKYPAQLKCDLHRHIMQRAHPHHGKSEDFALLVHFLHDVRVRGLAEITRALLEHDFEVVAFLVEPDLQSLFSHGCLPPASCLRSTRKVDGRMTFVLLPPLLRGSHLRTMVREVVVIATAEVDHSRSRPGLAGPELDNARGERGDELA